MSFKLKLRIALSAGFMLATSGAYAVNAQAPAAADQPPTNAAPTVVAASGLKKADLASLSVPPTEVPAAEATVAIVSAADKTASVPEATAPASFRARQPILLPAARPAATDPDTADEWSKGRRPIPRGVWPELHREITRRIADLLEVQWSISAFIEPP